MVHILKTDPQEFQQVIDKKMKCQIRSTADRDFKFYDEVWLKETTFTGAEMAEGAPLEYTGRVTARRITHLLRGPMHGIMDGWCLMSIEPL